MRRNDTGLSAQGVPVALEPLDEDERAHVSRVLERIGREIHCAGGWIGFERYMEIVLYEPGLGYYSAGAHKLGEGGDFTTSPEISRLFGGCVARQCAQVIGELGRGTILEIGAGSGVLAVDVLSRLAQLGCLPERYLILEVSADLRERQRRALAEGVPALLERVEWLDAPPGAPFEGIVLANEVLDALPVARFRWHSSHCEELGVSMGRDGPAWQARPASPALAEACAARAAQGGGWQDGYVSEYCPRLPAWTAAVTRAHRAGLALWIDYGLPRRHYYFAERRDGTLICHWRQRASDDPFLHPGLQDISAWVDFTQLAEAGRAAGYDLAGFTPQAHFLAALGIDREMQCLAGEDPSRLARLGHEARRLVMPGEMGERFKVMAWTRAMDLPLAGFALLDLRHTL